MEERILKAMVNISMVMEEGETVEDAKNRLFDCLYEGLCIPEDYRIDFSIEETEEVDA